MADVFWFNETAAPDSQPLTPLTPPVPRSGFCDRTYEIQASRRIYVNTRGLHDEIELR